MTDFQNDDPFADAPYRPDPIPEQDVDNVHRGQARMAYRLAHAYEGQLLHVHSIGWHRWDGARWVEDRTGAATRAVLDTLRKALAESLGNEALRTDVRRSESAAGINGVLTIAAALDAFAVAVNDLDPDPYLLNCANGTLDLRTMELREHDPRDRITKVTNAAYRPDAQHQAWSAFLGSSLPDPEVRAFLQRYAGLSLSGTVLEHVLAILTGEGRNGKSVFYTGIAWALGDYATSAEPDLFMHRDGAHPTGEMDLRGVRWVTVSESDKGRRLAEATVKRLTGGDKIKARRMRQDFVEFEPSHTAALVTNHLPKVSGDDPALWARLRVVPFDRVIPAEDRDPHLTEKLRLEADAILTWAIAGWQQYREDGLAEPEAVLTATSKYKTASDAVARFIEERCVVSNMVSARVGDLFDAFTRWATDDGAEPMSKRAFGDAMDKAGHPVTRGSGGTRYRSGIGIKAEETGDE